MKSSRLTELDFNIELYESDEAEVDRIFSFLELTDKEFHIPLSERVSLIEYASKLKENAANIFLTSKNQDVGHVAFYINKSDSFVFITSISVARRFSRMGLGGRLIKYVIDYAANKKIENISLEVQCSAKSVHEFYKALGFDFHSKDGICTFSKSVLCE